MADDKKLLNGDQSKKTDEQTNEKDFISDDDLRMGLLSWRPNWLQRFNHVNYFLLVLAIASISQGVIVNGVVMVSLQTLEKEFGFSSKISGFIVAGNDASALMIVTIVSFFGSRGNKPKWMAIGSICTGFGVLLFALPKCLIGDYIPKGRTELDVCSLNKTMSSNQAKCVTEASSILYIAIFFVSQLIMGAGTTPLYTLGPTYLDENVSPRAAPIYLGIWFASTMLGPGLGFVTGGLFLKTFTNIDLPEGFENMTVRDPNWIGAWWLGFVSLFGSFFLTGFLLLLFPRKMNNSTLKREKSIRDGHMPSSDNKVEYTMKGYIKQTFLICFNKVFMLSVFGLTIKTIFAVGLATFLAKILVLKFGVPPEKAGIWLGVILMPSMIIGIMAGSMFMRKLKVQVAAKTAAKICVIISIITAFNSFIFLIPGCKNTNLAGVKVPYHDRSNTDSLFSTCNDQCTCSEKVYMPICGSDGITYHSPCYAGCTVTLFGPDKMPYFGNCSCIPHQGKISANRSMLGMGSNVPPMMRRPTNASHTMMKKMSEAEKMKMMQIQMAMMDKSLVNRAIFGKCDRDCKNFFVFVVFICVSLIFSFLSGTPHKIMVLRCVPDNQRAFALGTQFLIMRSFSFMPAPIILGAILDSKCITWGYNACGEKQNCLDYDIDALSVNLVLLGCITSVLASVLYVLVWRMYPVVDTPSLLEKEEENHNM